jgi:apolipoprotein N-acyltransferase
VLLVGAFRYEGTPAGPRYFNTLIAVRRTVDGLEPAGVYDKHRLVPFGEFLPLEDLLTRLGVKALVHAPDSFTTGPEPAPMIVAGLPPFQPLICYESLFPGFTRRGAGASGVAPAFIVNVSNDAWFGRTSGPLQHLNLAQLPRDRGRRAHTSVDAHRRLGCNRRTGTGGGRRVASWRHRRNRLGHTPGSRGHPLPPPRRPAVHGPVACPDNTHLGYSGARALKTRRNAV